MTDYPDDADGEVLAELAAHGIDMSQPLHIEFPIVAPDEPSAIAIGEALAVAGYDCQIEYDDGEPDEDGVIDPEDEEFGPSWTVFATVVMVPQYDEIVRIQSDLDRIAVPAGGQSDGWGVMLDDADEDEDDGDEDDGEEIE